MAKFPFEDQTLRDLGFLNPNIRLNVPQYSVVNLANHFMPQLCGEEIDTIYLVSEEAGIDHFWAVTVVIKATS